MDFANGIANGVGYDQPVYTWRQGVLIHGLGALLKVNGMDVVIITELIMLFYLAPAC